MRIALVVAIALVFGAFYHETILRLLEPVLQALH